MIRFKDFDRYSDNLNEADVKDIDGLPDNFMRMSEEEARAKGINIDHQGQFSVIYSKLTDLIRETSDIIGRSGSGTIDEKLDSLEELAHEVIMEEFGDILESFEVPIELDLNIVRKGENVASIMKSLKDVPKDYDIEDLDEKIMFKESKKDDYLFGVSKKKILNMITQGEGKATKKIIAYSDTIRNGLEKIFGSESADKLIKNWTKMANLAHKMDWTFDVKKKASMMKDAPLGIVGATEVLWENKIYESTDLNKIRIKAVAIDFLMLIHESVKGVYRLLSSLSIKKDKEMAEKIKKATTSFFDEAQDFRYGSTAQKMFTKFVMNCKGSDKYKIIKPMVFTKLALDEERGGQFSDEKFLKITKSIFSSFKVVGGEIELNEARFKMSKARIVIEKLIKNIIKEEEKYREELEAWEREKGQEVDYETMDVDIEDKEEVEDLSKLSKREIQKLIDDALDIGDFKEVERLSSYLK